MVIGLFDLVVPSTVGALTGLLVVFLVLKNFPLSYKIKIGLGGFLSALVVAAIYFVLQSMTAGVILGTTWAFAWLYVIADRGSKLMPDLNSSVAQIAPINAANMSALMLAIIVFILGSAATVLKNASDRLSLIAFSAPPLLGAISFVMCTYFATKYTRSAGRSTKQYNAKRSMMWWDIGQTILISTIISIAFFIAIMIERIVV